jgi:hypothetical protein
MPRKEKKPKPAKKKTGGILRVAALKAARAEARAVRRGSDFLGLTGAAYTPGAWTSTTEGNPNSVWNGSVWSKVPKGTKDTINRGYPSNYTPSAWAQGKGSSSVQRPNVKRLSRFEQALDIIIGGPKASSAKAKPAATRTAYDNKLPPTQVDKQFPQFKPAKTLIGMIYDIARGVDPYSGDYQPGYGAAGTLKPGAGTEWMSPQYERFDAGFGRDRTKGPGTFSGNYRIGGRPPVRNRPSWINWYENNQSLPSTGSGVWDMSFNP